MTNFVLKVIRKLLNLVYRRIDYKIAMISLGSYAYCIDKLKNNFQCRTIEKADLPLIGTEFGITIRHKFMNRMEKGERGYLLLDTKGDMIGYVWAANQTVKNEGIPPFVFDIAPKEGNIYWYDGFTTPDRRNSGGMTALLAFLLQQSTISGFKTAFYLIDSRNHPILKVALKLGFQIYGEIRYRRYLTYIKKDMNALFKFCEPKQSKI